jgi:hypothetical protein
VYIASNDGVVDELEKIWKEAAVALWRQYNGSCLEELPKTTNNLNHAPRLRTQVWNVGRNQALSALTVRTVALSSRRNHIYVDDGLALNPEDAGSMLLRNVENPCTRHNPEDHSGLRAVVRFWGKGYRVCEGWEEKRGRRRCGYCKECYLMCWSPARELPASLLALACVQGTRKLR